MARTRIYTTRRRSALHDLISSTAEPTNPFLQPEWDDDPLMDDSAVVCLPMRRYRQLVERARRGA